MTLVRRISLLALLGIGSICSSFSCHEKCRDVFSKGIALEQSQFHFNSNKTNHGSSLKFAWRWKEQNDTGIWEVFYEEFSERGTKSGGLQYLKPIKKRNARLYWKYSNGILIWTSDYKKIPPTSWTVKVCNSDLKLHLESHDNAWELKLGNLVLEGGKSGKLHVDQSFAGILKTARLTRNRREVEDFDGQAKTLWDRLRGYFKELFDQGPNDQRGWWQRFTDWLLGFIERALSRR